MWNSCKYRFNIHLFWLDKKMKLFKIPLVIVWIFILINSKTIAQNGLSDNEIFKGRIMSIVEVYEEKSNGSEKNPS